MEQMLSLLYSSVQQILWTMKLYTYMLNSYTDNECDLQLRLPYPIDRINSIVYRN